MHTTTHRPRSAGGTPKRRFGGSKPHGMGSFTGKRQFSKSTGGFSSGRRSGGGNRRRGGGGRKMPSFNPSHFINKNPVNVEEVAYIAKHDFTMFGLNPRLVQTIHRMGITTPSPIQDQIIPEILKGNDVIGLAETGTGKTAAFLVPILEKTFAKDSRETLILAPTRELAIQIEDELKKLSQGFRIFSVTCVGGMNIRPQIRSLKRKNHFIIGTPGRILDLINRKDFNPAKVTTVILDEADRMLDMGFINDIKKILEGTPKNRETLFFSATMNAATEKIVNDFMNKPIRISVKKKEVTNSIEQDVIPHGHHNKFETLIELLKKPELKRVLIFGAMKHSVEKLSQELSRSGIKAESIHGNKSHVQRQRSLNNFKTGHARVLVATDVAARGIHVDGVTHVINYDLPQTMEDYVHRIGRTGRGIHKGKALTFVPETVAAKTSHRRY